MKRILFIFPYAPSYRAPIYQLMDQHFDCEFHFSPKSHVRLKYLDYSQLKNVYFDIPEKMLIGEWCYYKGIRQLALEHTDTILMTGIFRNLSEWYILLKNHFSKHSKRVVFWTHATYGNDGFIKKWIKRTMLSFADMVLVYGHYAKEYLIEQRMVKPEHVDVIYNSLDYDKQMELYNLINEDTVHQHFKNHNKTIIFIGRLTPVKKLHMVIESLYILKNQGRDYNLILVGDGEVKADLEKLVKKYRLEDCVWFYGECYEEDQAASLLKCSDLCVSPGNVGLTAIHALTFGCPVITHNNFKHQMPEFEAIEEGKTGLFFQENDNASLAESIQQWFETHPDRNIVAENCQQRIKKLYNPQHQLDILKRTL